MENKNDEFEKIFGKNYYLNWFNNMKKVSIYDEKRNQSLTCKGA
nr:hypothetical protein [Moritella viscosa]SHO14563.1 RTX-III toxin determinant A from serotype 8-APX-IIIA-Cytolysin IIIA [Moritella viscosa]